jgi:hypothetical protein
VARHVLLDALSPVRDLVYQSVVKSLHHKAANTVADSPVVAIA